MASLAHRIVGTALVGLGLVLCLSAAPVAAQPNQAQQDALRSNCRPDFMSNCSSVRPGGAEALQCLQRNVAKLSPGCQQAVHAVSPPSAPPQQTTAAPAAAATAAPPASAPPPVRATTATPAPAAPTATAPARVPASTPRQPARTATAPATAPAAAAAAQRPTPQQQAAIRQSCQSDFMARCPGVQPGGASALQCLQRNAAQLSPNCQRAVAAVGGGAAAPATAAAAPAAAPTAEQQQAIKFTCQRDFTVNCRGVTPGGPDALACLQRNASRLSPNCQTSLAAIGNAAPATAGPAAAQGSPGPGGLGPFPIRRAIRDRLMSQ